MFLFQRLIVSIAVFFVFPSVFAHASPSSKLGSVNFPTSGSPETQKLFLRGVAALHSFWYDEALKSFQESTKVDPNFVMGYWGEAMTHNKPLWEKQDTEAAREALTKIKDISKITVRELSYLEAVMHLYGDGDKKSRDKAYANAMEKIYRQYPEDLEAACFYSLSLLGVSRHEANKLRSKVKAGALAMEVFQKNPEHPCSAHYTIHAFDHPDLAILALPAARRYAEIAPASHHANHMPAHIFVQLGMWPEAVASNEAGWKYSKEWVEREGLPISKRDYHSLQWLHYVTLQQGKYEKADIIFQEKLKDIEKAVKSSEGLNAKVNRRTAKYIDRMVAASVFEKEQWEFALSFIEPPGWKPKKYNQATLLFVRGFAAAKLGSSDADKYLADLQSIRAEGFKENHYERLDMLDVWISQIEAVKHANKKNFVEAIDFAKKAILSEQKLPDPSGPPKVLKPSYELLGEIQLQVGNAKEAAKQFAISISRHTNRVRSLVGAARATSASGDKESAKDWYYKFLTTWAKADKSLPELAEAKAFLDLKK
jgi:tetratricopeptide (TPR) repeat protein